MNTTTNIYQTNVSTPPTLSLASSGVANELQTTVCRRTIFSCMCSTYDTTSSSTRRKTVSAARRNLFSWNVLHIHFHTPPTLPLVLVHFYLCHLNCQQDILAHIPIYSLHLLQCRVIECPPAPLFIMLSPLNRFNPPTDRPTNERTNPPTPSTLNPIIFPFKLQDALPPIHQIQWPSSQSHYHYAVDSRNSPG